MPNEIVKTDLDMTTWEVMRCQVDVLIKSGFLPKAVDTPEKALAIALKGRELGLPMMQAITSIHVIDGKPTISAELMAALVYQRLSGAILRCIETSDKIATYEAGRPGDKILKMSFTWEEAVRAGLTGKDNWRKYPAAMLRARCCSAICRIVFPDAIMGVDTPDELGAITTEEGEPVEGEIINITPSKPMPQRKSKASPDIVLEPSNEALTISDVAVKRSKTKGKPWTKYAITASDGIIYSTFDTKLGERAIKAMEMKAPVAIKGEEGSYGWELKELHVREISSDETKVWTKREIQDILKSAENLDGLNDLWRSLTPHIAKLEGPDRVICQMAYDKRSVELGNG